MNDNKFNLTSSIRVMLPETIAVLTQFENVESIIPYSPRHKLKIFDFVQDHGMGLNIGDCYSDSLDSYPLVQHHDEISVKTLVNFKRNMIPLDDFQIIIQQQADNLFSIMIAIGSGPLKESKGFNLFSDKKNYSRMIAVTLIKDLSDYNLSKILKHALKLRGENSSCDKIFAEIHEIQQENILNIIQAYQRV